MSGAYAPTTEEIVDQLIADVDGLGKKFTAATVDNAAATFTTTDPVTNFLGADEVAEDYRGIWFWNPAAGTAIDRERQIASHAVSGSTATFTVYGGNFAAGQTNATCYLLGIQPSVLIALINDALGREYTEITVGLIPEVADGDLQGSGVTDWTDSNATSSKVATAANTYPGLQRSLRVANSGADGYTRTGNLRIPRGKSLYWWAIARADAQTIKAQITDSSGTEIESVTTEEEDWMFLWMDASPASSVEEIQIRLGGASASCDGYWATMGFIRPGHRNLVLPSAVRRRNRLKALSVAEFHVNGSESGVEVAGSRKLRKLIEGVDYRFVDNQLAANAQYVEALTDWWLDCPVWVTYMAPFSDHDTLTITSITSTSTSCDLDKVVAWSRHLIGKRYPEQFGEHRNDALEEAAELAEQSVTDPPKQERVISWYRR